MREAGISFVIGKLSVFPTRVDGPPNYNDTSSAWDHKPTKANPDEVKMQKQAMIRNWCNQYHSPSLKPRWGKIQKAN